MKLRATLLLLALAGPAAGVSQEVPKPDPVVALVLSDLNEQERWLYGVYASDPARLKALRIRGGQVDLRDADEKRKFLADTRKKLVNLAEKEYGFNGGEFGMLSAVITDPAKAEAFRAEAAQADPSDKEAQKALIGRWRKEIVGWAEGYMAAKHETDMDAKTVEGMIGPEEKALLEQMRRNDERGFKVGTFTKWIGEANRKMAKGDPEGRRKALDLVKRAREGMNENIGKYLELPEIAKLREKKETVVVKAETAPEEKPESKSAPESSKETPEPRTVSGRMGSAMEELENAAKASEGAASTDSQELMLAGAMTPFSGGDLEGRVVDAVASPRGGQSSAGPAAAVLEASSACPGPQKGLKIQGVPQPSAQPGAKKSAEQGKGNGSGSLWAMIGAALAAIGSFFTQK